MGRQRGSLEVGEDPADGGTPACLDRPFEGTFRTDKDRAGDEELGDVHIERRLLGAERRGREVDEHRPVADNQDAAQVESSVRDAGVVQTSDLFANLIE